MAGEPVVRVEGLVRRYEAQRRRPGLLGALRDLVQPEREVVHALDGLDLEVSPGEIVGLLGPNGAGKSTAVKCLTGILAPSGGTVRVAGLDPWRDRRRCVARMGVVFGQRTQLWWDLAVQEGFDLLAAVFEVPEQAYRERLGTLSEVLELQPLLRSPVRELSLGQRMRCDLAAALLHAPDVLLLDEPTIGLDVAVKLRLRDFVRGVASSGCAVLLTSHDLADVESLCGRVVLLHRGRRGYEGDLEGMRRRVGGARVLRVQLAGALSEADLADLGRALGVEAARVGEAAFEVRIGAGRPAGPLVAEVLQRAEVVDLSLREPPIEEVVAAFFAEER